MPPNRHANRALLVLLGINVLNFFDRQMLGPLAEPIRREFHLSDAQLGALTTTFTLLYAFAGIPLARLADSGSRRLLLAAGMALWSTLTAAGALATGFVSLLVSRLGVAVGEAVCAPASASWIGELFPAGQRAAALARFMLGVPLGSAAGLAAGGIVAQRYGWRAALVVAAVPALFLLPLLLALPESRREHTESAGWSSIRGLLSMPTFVWIIASGALVNFVLYTFSAFLPAFLTRYHHWSVAQSGAGFGVGLLVTAIVIGVFAARWGDWIARSRRDGRMLSASGFMLLAAPLSLAGTLQPSGSPLSCLALFTAANLALNMYYGLVYSSIQDIVPANLRATAMSVYFLAMYLTGASFGPLVTGLVSDRMARRAAEAAGSPVITEAARATGLHDAMFLIPGVCVALAAVLYAGSRTISSDLDRRAAWASGAAR